jgi:NO-binding membrane sensor protein with MHYT domain
MMNKTKHNFWLDVTIFVALLITVTTGFLSWQVIPHELGIAFPGFPRSVWVTFHICSGMLSLAGVVMHVTWHRDWLKALRGRPLGEMSEKLRTNRIADRIMWIIFITANVSGALAWAMHFGDDIYVVTVPDRLHVAVGIALTFLVTLHLTLHWKWIPSTTRRYILVNS